MREPHVLNHLLRSFADFRKDPEVTEIVVNECGRFGVERSGDWSWHDADDLTFRRLDSIGVHAGFALASDFSPEHPLCRAVLPGGERAQLCRPPATKPGIISMTIRKPSERMRLLDDDDLDGLFEETNLPRSVAKGYDEELACLFHEGNWRQFFRRAVQKRKSIGVCGPTGSGKTDFLKRLLMEIPEHERIVTMEDTPEFGTAGPYNKVNLFFGSEINQLTCDDTRRAALRMRPDRVIVQEVRGAEAMGFLQALGNGHSGMTSWHSNEGGEWEALATMVRQSDTGRAIPPDDVPRYIKQFIDIVVWAAKEDKKYKVPTVWLKGVSE